MIAIVGAGISGLSLACFLKSQGFPEQELFLFEATKECGGVLQTIEQQGYKIESAAALYPYHKTAPRMLCQLLGLEQSIVPLQSKKRYIQLEQKLRKFSLQPLYILSNSLISWKAKYTLLKSLWKTAGAQGPESLQTFFVRQFGKEIFEKIVEPCLSGIFAGAPQNLSLTANFPHLEVLEKKHLSLSRAILKEKKQKPYFVSFEKGMGQLVASMKKYLANRIFYEQKLENISFQKTKIHCQFSKKKLFFDKVVLSLPAPAAAKVLQQDEICKWLEQIAYAPLVVCALGFRSQKAIFPSGALGFLVPVMEDKDLLGGFFMSNMFANRTPAKDYHLLQFMLGGMQAPKVMQWSDEKILEKMQVYCKKTLQIKEKFCYHKIIRWKEAIAQYNMQHTDILKSIKKLEQKAPIYFHSSAYRGIGLANNIENSFQLAHTIMNG